MKRHHTSSRQGNVSVLVALLLPVLCGMAAFAIDTGRIGVAKSRLQAAADAAALAAVEELPDGNSAVTVAQNIAGYNLADESNVVASSNVEFGIWDDDNQTFTASTAAAANAVRVTAQLSENNDNSLTLFFGGILGVSSTGVSASAIAFYEPGIGTRFLIDDEMIDSDVPSIEALATALGRDVVELVTPRGFNLGKAYGDSNWTWVDNFLDMPAGSQLSLPTGQGTDYDNNDAGIFDIDNPDFPFTTDQAFQDFVMYSETGGDTSKWGTDTLYIYNALDPLVGVAPVTDDTQYPSFVNPNFTHVSPVTFSDMSTLNDVGGVPQINAKGLRRGLIAFKIIAVGTDVDGSGAVLPELVIEIVDPSTTSLNDIKPGGSGGKPQIVQ